MHKLAHARHFLRPPLKHCDFVRDARFAQFPDAQAEIQDRGESYGGEVVGVGVDDEADVSGGGGDEGAVGDEVGVHDGVEEEEVDTVVDVAVHVVI